MTFNPELRKKTTLKKEVNTEAKSGEDKNRIWEDKGEKGRAVKRVACAPALWQDLAY